MVRLVTKNFLLVLTILIPENLLFFYADGKEKIKMAFNLLPNFWRSVDEERQRDLENL